MEVFANVPRHLFVVAVDFLRLCIWLVLLVAVFVPLERIFGLHRQEVFRKAFFADLAYYVISGLSVSSFLILPMAAIGWALHFLVPHVLLESVAAMPLAMRFAVSMVVAEIG